jgi:hypothetical protein
MLVYLFVKFDADQLRNFWDAQAKTLDPGLRRDDGSSVKSTSTPTVIPMKIGIQRLSSINKINFKFKNSRQGSP